MIKEDKKGVKDLEKELTALILLLIPEFTTEDGSLKLNDKNMRLANLTSVFKEFNKEFQGAFLASIFAQIQGLKKDFDTYYKGLGFSKFTQSHKNMDIFNESVLSYFNRFALAESLRLELQGFITSGVSSNITPELLAKGVKKELKGKLEKYYEKMMWEEIIQIERIQNNFYAKELGLNWFIYEGGLIETSRKFCTKRDGKLFHRDDAKKWRFDPTLPDPATADIYKPLIELGRWNCRHTLKWITDEQADDKRRSDKGV